ncbi:hypothetical protein F5J12DRAFT_888324 [Pisolithus orientalis]|uniref:uncharacterized protein n=1 Tax=Pisolithus orientalis TaxID=936130 RepID=UPI00222407AA|nr:uncharacterized protein F5J12DRAFT_888324 [Pisolithus orientalis]KAI6030518.1 hypothetical protein F5J12DRAFT_888324 [Pisolithus orientalis]
MKQGCEKSTKAMGKKVQAGASVAQSLKAAKASPSKRAADDNDDKVEVVESHAHVKVHVDQLTEALEKIGVE